MGCSTSTTNMQNRCAGVLVGLAAGDRIGGPTRLAILLSESLIQQQGFNAAHVTQSYYGWFKSSRTGQPHKVDHAFGTGKTFHRVFHKYSKGQPMIEAAEIVQEEHGEKGIGPAQRNMVMAMADISDEDLMNTTHLESYLTHPNQVSYEVSLACNVICRDLIRGKYFNSAVQHASNLVKDLDVKSALKEPMAMDRKCLKFDDYAPNALRAAIYFVRTGKSFEDTLLASIEFAGSDNFCPVLVGALAGAKYGVKAILGSWKVKMDGDSVLIRVPHKIPALKHCTPELLSQVFYLANELSRHWFSPRRIC